MKTNSARKFLLLPLASALALSAHAVPIITTSSLNDGSVFTVSNTDLYQTSLSSLTETGGLSGFANNTLSLLTNGSFGGANSDGSASVAPVLNTTLTFGLNLVAGPLGYTLTNLRSYAGWDAGRDGQEYTVSYSTVAAPGTFITLSTIPQFNPTGVPFNNAHTLVSITDGSGTLATGVAAVRYTFTGFENSGTAYREFDAFGSPTTGGNNNNNNNVPDAGSSALLLSAALAGFAAFSSRLKKVR